MNDLMAGTSEFATIIDFIRYGLTQAHGHGLFFGHGTDNVRDDIYSLILGSLNLPPMCDPVLLHARLTQGEREKLYAQLVKRIVEKIPVPYLIRQAYFCGLPFYVDERVLIPRSPIAELIEQQFSPWIEADQVASVLDLCTGSGCIAIACCYAFPESSVDAVDLSQDALDVATINRDRHNLQGTLQLIQSDCWQNVPKVRYDIIVSNPPYVGDEEMRSLPSEYLHEPSMALRADNNGLAIVEKILAHAHHYLTDHGILVVEVGNSEDALVEAYPDLAFTWLEFENGGQGVFLLTRQQLQEYFDDKR
ncbi:50S ribosomal protein L3 N(5)-glutamine methyltransferase [Legionella spiritensis]|uniref:N5-glutamine S-adenosyl-L-methionine-dependent methyltransferase n=1 Tax=Legionella spiritensis TaxID=452 RepID=A0A0W0Z5S3_LEGSP|nr:50S ribosomal protein L3 N(5)-glutamine methyltransferase [Legionella spiritensis]KTD64519.1 N5-glutamine S-adenosyl-L-methionine-dependent methyltransferase [Legionella spiritensis]SNV33107.1 adenine specific methylase [Legionella spiritensis]